MFNHLHEPVNNLRPLFIIGRLRFKDLICSCTTCAENAYLSSLHWRSDRPFYPKLICQRELPDYYNGLEETLIKTLYILYNYTIIDEFVYYLQRDPESFYRAFELDVNLNDCYINGESNPPMLLRKTIHDVTDLRRLDLPVSIDTIGDYPMYYKIITPYEHGINEVGDPMIPKILSSTKHGGEVDYSLTTYAPTLTWLFGIRLTIVIMLIQFMRIAFAHLSMLMQLLNYYQCYGSSFSVHKVPCAL